MTRALLSLLASFCFTILFFSSPSSSQTIISRTTTYNVTRSVAPAQPAFPTPSTALQLSNDAVDLYVPLGFTFVFFNVTYTAVNIGANGNIQLQTASSDWTPDAFGGGTESFAPIIAFFYADLYPNTANARVYATNGTAPNRQFWLRLTNVGYCCTITGTGLTADVILSEGTNKIEFRYYQVMASSSSQLVAIGLENIPDPVTGNIEYLQIYNDYMTDTIAANLTGSAFTFAPIVSFANAQGPAPPAISASTSTVYTGGFSNAPARTAFTPTGTIPLVSSGNGVNLVPIGFNFVFYNVSYSSVFVSDNGNLQFQTSSSIAYASSFGTSSSSPWAPGIAFFFVDLFPTIAPASQTYVTTGSAPNRQFILRFENIPLQTYISTGLLTCDVVLFEGSNTIEIRYYNVPAFTSTYSASIGIQNSINPATGVYDYASLLNYQIPGPYFTTAITNKTYSFTPRVNFVNPTVFVGRTAPVPVLTSQVYTSTNAVNVPAQISLTSPTFLSVGDNDVTGVTIGFNFVFYNVSYSSLFVSSNGNLQFSTASSTQYPYIFGATTGSTNSLVAPVIAFFYADLNPSFAGASRVYSVIGSAPNRQFIVRFSNVAYQSYIGGGVLSCDVILTETSNTIEFRYYSVPSITQNYYYVDIGVQGPLVGSTYDYLAIVNYQALDALGASSITNKSYTISPIVNFINPRVFTLSPPTITDQSPLYDAVRGTVPPRVAFTPSGSLPLADNIVTAAPLGFQFVFYNVSYSTVYVSSNGNIQFRTASSSQYPYTFGTSSNVGVAPFIAFWFADLNMTAAPASMAYTTTGTAGSRQWILRVTDVPYTTYVGGGVLNCDVVLSEGTNTIEFRYYSIGGMAQYYYVDVGIQSAVSSTSTYDYIAVINYLNANALITSTMVNSSYTFSPVAGAFSNPVVFPGPTAPIATTTSTVYRSAAPTGAPTRAVLTSPTTLPLIDNDVALIPLGLNFTFYGTSYDNAFIGANGNIQFRTSSISQYPYSLGTSSNQLLSPMIAFFYTDLYPVVAPASRVYGTIGTAPNRQFILQYNNVPYSALINTGSSSGSPGGSLNCDVVLSETTNTIELRYYTVSGFNYLYAYVDIGLQNSVIGTTYDSLAIVNYQNLNSLTAAGLVNTSYLISPITNFVNAPYYNPTAPPPASVGTSTVYSTTISRTVPRVTLTSPVTLPYTDNDVTSVPIGFNFVFYNISYTDLYVSGNGNIQFQTGSPTAYPYTFGSQNAVLSPVIAFWFSDLYSVSTPSIRTYATTGTAGSRQFILQYTNVPYQSYISANVLTCDVVLTEGSNTIEFRYYSAPAMTANYYYLSVGIQNTVSGGSYDYVSIINYLNADASTVSPMNNVTYTFTPITNFVNPRGFSLTRVPQSSSQIYTTVVTNGLPALPTFTAMALPPTDNDVTIVSIGFPFVFYNISYDNFWIGANGDIQFQSGNIYSSSAAFGSGNAQVAPFIAFFYVDLLGTQGSRTYGVMGTAPNRQFILRYTNVPTQSYIATGSLSCDVILTETTNTIELRYYQVPAFTYTYYYASIGIENSANTTGAYDWIAIINNIAVDRIVGQGLVNTSFLFRPTVSFTNPGRFQPIRPIIVDNSPIYTITNYTTVPSMISFTPRTPELPLTDNAVTLVSIGFNFTFYGMKYQNVFVSSNGNLQFQTGSTSAYPYSFTSTSNDALLPMIAFYYADLYTNTSSRSYGTIGSAPTRQFIIRYDGATFATSPTIAAVTCDVILTETANSVELRYYYVSPVPYTYNYLDIGIAGSSSDYISIVNYQSLSAAAALGLTNTSYLIQPATPFPADAPLFISRIFTPPDNSPAYNVAAVKSVVDPVVFAATLSPALIAADDSVTLNIPLGFSFDFYNVSYTTVTVSTNGNIQFVTSSSSSFAPLFPSGVSSYSPIIAFFWTNLYPILTTQRSYGTIGTAPSRQWILRWTNVWYCCTTPASGGLTMDIVLSERTNTIQFRYYQVPITGSNSVSIGIQNVAVNGVTDYIAVTNSRVLDGLDQVDLTNTTITFAPAYVIQPVAASSSSTGVAGVSSSAGQSSSAASSSSAIASSSSRSPISSSASSSSSPVSASSSAASSSATPSSSPAQRSSSSSSSAIPSSSSSSPIPSFSSTAPFVPPSTTSIRSSSSAIPSSSSAAISSSAPSSSSSSGDFVVAPSSSSSSSLSGGAIAGIVIGSVFGCLILVCAVVFGIFASRRSGSDEKQMVSTDASEQSQIGSSEQSTIGHHADEVELQTVDGSEEVETA